MTHDFVALKKEFEDELLRIATWWEENAIDRENGGYLGYVSMDGKVDPQAPQSLVMVSRILWFFSAAGRATKNLAHIQQADMAAAYIRDHFIDPDFGGVFWQLTHKGKIDRARKHGYAQAFTIYAFAAHYQLTKNKDSLAIASSLFEKLEANYLDPVGEGYWEAFARDWTPLEDVRLSDVDDPAPKSMNTHLHILEAYAELYRANQNPRVGQALRNLITLFLDKVYNPDGRFLRLFWENDWTDVSRAVSFGHDIEAAWLLTDAAETLGDHELTTRVQRLALTLTDEVYRNAIGPDGEVFNERDFKSSKIDEIRVWWVQAEAIVGFLNAFQISRDQKFLDAAVKNWTFTKDHIIDLEGEWRPQASFDRLKDDMWLGPWKSCYHNGRAMLEAIDRLEKIQSSS